MKLTDGVRMDTGNVARHITFDRPCEAEDSTWSTDEIVFSRMAIALNSEISTLKANKDERMALLGIDSLISVDLSNWLDFRFGKKISSAKLSSILTIQDVIDIVNASS